MCHVTWPFRHILSRFCDKMSRDVTNMSRVCHKNVTECHVLVTCCLSITYVMPRFYTWSRVCHKNVTCFGHVLLINYLCDATFLYVILSRGRARDLESCLWYLVAKRNIRSHDMRRMVTWCQPLRSRDSKSRYAWYNITCHVSLSHTLWYVTNVTVSLIMDHVMSHIETWHHVIKNHVMRDTMSHVTWPEVTLCDTMSLVTCCCGK